VEQPNDTVRRRESLVFYKSLNALIKGIFQKKPEEDRIKTGKNLISPQNVDAYQSVRLNYYNEIFI
jgi:hypothetical protein